MNITNEGYRSKYATTGNISNVFPETFKLVLSTDYNEGTYYGNYDRIDKASGQSAIYVNQEIENDLENIVNYDDDSFKCLVGFTGIGKTTLLKNYFRVFERKAEIHDDRLIIYISFYGSIAADEDEGFIPSYVQDASEALRISNETVREARKHPDFWNNLYDYIYENYRARLSRYNDLPGFDESGDPKERKKQILYLFEKEAPDVFQVWVLKYHLKHCPHIKRVIFVFDDLETVNNYEAQERIVKSAMTVAACLKTDQNRTYRVKTFLSLRSLTIRKHLDTLGTALRIERDRSNIIVKDKIPRIEEVFNKRIEEGTGEVRLLEKRGQCFRNISA